MKSYKKAETDEEVRAQLVEAIGETSGAAAFGLYRIYRERDKMTLDEAYSAAIHAVMEIWTSGK